MNQNQRWTEINTGGMLSSESELQDEKSVQPFLNLIRYLHFCTCKTDRESLIRFIGEVEDREHRERVDWVFAMFRSEDIDIEKLLRIS